ncbi:MAG: hypothetical protein AAB899_03730 [Patescibacteria group bacterium]
MDAIKAGNEKPDYEAAVEAVHELGAESPQETTRAAIGKMVLAIAEAGLTLDQRETIFIRLNGRAFSLQGIAFQDNKSKQRAKYIAREIGSAITALRNHSNVSRQKGPKDYLAKYYLWIGQRG